MFPSSTVENYIKVIHAQQVRLTDPDGLVPMGHLARRMGVTPGTATTMVKALADSGLVHYAPYAGVRLTPRRRAARRPGHPPPSPDRAFSRPGHRHQLGRGARRGREARTRRVGTLDRADGRDARPPGGGPARRSDSRTPTASSLSASCTALLTCPLARAGHGHARGGSGRGISALRREYDLKPGQQLAVDARDEVADSVRCTPREGGL